MQEAIKTAREKEGPIGAELAAVLGMSDTDAKAFGTLVDRLQGLLEADRNKRKVATLLKGLDKKLPVRVEDIVKKITTAEGLGAMNNATFQEKLRQMFRPKKLTDEKIAELGRLVGGDARHPRGPSEPEGAGVPEASERGGDADGELVGFTDGGLVREHAFRGHDAVPEHRFYRTERDRGVADDHAGWAGSVPDGY